MTREQASFCNHSVASLNIIDSTPTTNNLSYTCSLYEQFAVVLLLLLLHPFNGHFSRTTWLTRYQKGKTSLDLNEAKDDGSFGMELASAGPYANNLHLVFALFCT